MPASHTLRMKGTMMDTSHDCFVVCPYCGNEHADAWEICKDESPRKYDCQKCGKPFDCWAIETVTYCAEATEPTECDEPFEARTGTTAA